ncbi:MazG-like protein [Ursidibacter arcticus]
MTEKTFIQLLDQAKRIREGYHRLERHHHGSDWSVEEDALAFLSDAGLVGRLTIAQQQRWPASGCEGQLEHKLAECVWWLMVLAERMDIDLNAQLNKFMNETQNKVCP